MSYLEKKDRIIIKRLQWTVRIGEDRYGSGNGRTKKAAEQEAAYQSILAVRKKNYE